MNYATTQNQLNTLSYALEQVGFQSMDLEQTGMAIANYNETEPSIVQAMMTVFANAISANAQRLEELAEILEQLHNDIAGNQNV